MFDKAMKRYLEQLRTSERIRQGTLCVGKCFVSIELFVSLANNLICFPRIFFLRSPVEGTPKNQNN